MVSGLNTSTFVLGLDPIAIKPGSSFFHTPIIPSILKPSLTNYSTYFIKKITIKLISHNSKSSRGFACYGYTPGQVPNNI